VSKEVVVSGDAETSPPLDELDAAVRDARKVWPTKDVRLDPRPVLDALNRLRAQHFVSPSAGEAIDKFANAIQHARPVSLSDQVRINRDELRQLHADVRSAVEA
jgi:hypothetical protein